MMLEKVFWTWRVSASSSDDSSMTSGSSWMRATRYGSLGDEVVDAHALAALDEDAQRPVGHLQHARDDAGDADPVEVVGAGLLDLGSLLATITSMRSRLEHVVDELDRALLADRQRRHRVREGDHLLAAAGPAARRAAATCLAVRLLRRSSGLLDDLDHRVDRRVVRSRVRDRHLRGASLPVSATGSSTRRMPSS